MNIFEKKRCKDCRKKHDFQANKLQTQVVKAFDCEIATLDQKKQSSG